MGPAATLGSQLRRCKITGTAAPIVAVITTERKIPIPIVMAGPEPPAQRIEIAPTKIAQVAEINIRALLSCKMRFTKKAALAHEWERKSCKLILIDCIDIDSDSVKIRGMNMAKMMTWDKTTS